jgi:protease I
MPGEPDESAPRLWDIIEAQAGVREQPDRPPVEAVGQRAENRPQRELDEQPRRCHPPTNDRSARRLSDGILRPAWAMGITTQSILIIADTFLPGEPEPARIFQASLTLPSDSTQWSIALRFATYNRPYGTSRTSANIGEEDTMAGTQLTGMRVAILATDDFEQSELTEPKKALQEAGAEVLIVAPHSGQIQGMNHDEKADQFSVDMQIAEADPEEFDAVMLPGGALNADTLRVLPEAQNFVRQIEQAGKPLAVICHGAWLLASSGLVRGRTMTSYHTIQDDLKNAGADWQDAEVVRDRNWVSSRKPSDLPAFNREMLALFSEHHAGQTARAA